jgi:hypothetical protein
VGSLSAKNAIEKFSRLGTFKETGSQDYNVLNGMYRWIGIDKQGFQFSLALKVINFVLTLTQANFMNCCLSNSGLLLDCSLHRIRRVLKGNFSVRISVLMARYRD